MMKNWKDLPTYLDRTIQKNNPEASHLFAYTVPANAQHRL